MKKRQKQPNDVTYALVIDLSNCTLEKSYAYDFLSLVSKDERIFKKRNVLCFIQQNDRVFFLECKSCQHKLLR